MSETKSAPWKMTEALRLKSMTWCWEAWFWRLNANDGVKTDSEAWNCWFIKRRSIRRLPNGPLESLDMYGIDVNSNHNSASSKTRRQFDVDNWLPRVVPYLGYKHGVIREDDQKEKYNKLYNIPLHSFDPIHLNVIANIPVVVHSLTIHSLASDIVHSKY